MNINLLKKKKTVYEHFSKSNLKKQYSDLENDLQIIDQIVSKNSEDKSTDDDILVKQRNYSSLHINFDKMHLFSIDYDNLNRKLNYCNIVKYINIIYSDEFLDFIIIINIFRLCEQLNNGIIYFKN